MIESDSFHGAPLKNDGQHKDDEQRELVLYVMQNYGSNSQAEAEELMVQKLCSSDRRGPSGGRSLEVGREI
eukprot:scaffold2258_cov84-Skeletonema_dohrnii-CCMP3373.AAC.9